MVWLHAARTPEQGACGHAARPRSGPATTTAAGDPKPNLVDAGATLRDSVRLWFAGYGRMERAQQDRERVAVLLGRVVGLLAAPQGQSAAQLV